MIILFIPSFAILIFIIHQLGGRMKDIDVIKDLHKKKQTQSILKYRSEKKESVKSLQNVLFELGFGRELKWDMYGADGDYGNCTATAVDTFCSYNKIKASGRAVSGKTAERIIYLYALIDHLKIINEAVQHGEIETRIKQKGRYKTGIAALQSLLAELGYTRQLKWNKYGADGDFGNCTTAALKKYAEVEGYLDSGEVLTDKLAESILQKFKPYFGSEFLRTTIKAHGLSQTISGKNIIISDGSLSWTFRKYQKGLFTYGKNRPKDFIVSHFSSLPNFGLTKSAINVMLSVSENEGNLDAVNTWDNAHLSFGMFQWTLGTATNPGELPALLNKIKTKAPTIFQKYFLEYGLDIFQANETTGFLKWDGQQIVTTSKKELMRDPVWAFRFWKAGQDDLIMAIEVEHAYSRIKTFYKSNSYKVENYFISDLVTSEYGVALLLDNHVNRPGYLVDTLTKALKNTGQTNPNTWNTGDEKTFLNEYLNVRKTFGRYPMTDSDGRAFVTKRYLTSGIISDTKDSFKI